MGSCQGILRASPEGIAFQATSGKDSFRAALQDLARFDVDYLAKVMRLSVRADPLLVFQQRVEEARKRL